MKGVHIEAALIALVWLALTINGLWLLFGGAR